VQLVGGRTVTRGCNRACRVLGASEDDRRAVVAGLTSSFASHVMIVLLGTTGPASEVQQVVVPHG
jgi:hypothetical protein